MKNQLALISWSLRNSLYENVLQYVGWDHYCPICNRWQKPFKTFGLIPRKNAQCRYCGSLERHRATWVFFKNRTNLYDGTPKKMLHIAPESHLAERLKQVPDLEYLSADLDSKQAMITMDITDIQFPDNFFDIIFCSHVLEHVPDDRKAMRELNRVLSFEGWALIVVPVTVKQTFEDPSITDSSERLRLFGQDDHVRRYGSDFQDRLVEEGWKVSRFTEIEIVGEENEVKFGVRSDPLFYCEKEIGSVLSQNAAFDPAVSLTEPNR